MPQYQVTVTDLVLGPLTLTQLEAFIVAGMAAIPGAELQSIELKLTLVMVPPVATPGT